MKKELYIVMATYLAAIFGMFLSYFSSVIGYIVLAGIAGCCILARKGDSKWHFNLVLQSICILAVFKLLSVGLALAAITTESLKIMSIMVLASQITKIISLIVPVFRVIKGVKNIDPGVTS
ncbi:hypothetical protein [Vibrio neptunius]|uniref:ATP synthase subunit I n=1 Tax=Vibrio neptunius TaxID=170651 RepID=A0ABS3A872_9VIBR|nr:hypothetical protein [Vibrio neptunius]MBN3495744.1 hypothetical protein [Vibrio neptunius]MBN3514517.1 hypothetical protein [Vibrio neptunius]MBN3548368.1 hypothetical protein [Vibrio neptunius]MBN3580558.1 hypothetical protein [Vibrio neptunius]MCH9874225.1 hypothetical protein [Vibrio neptunius]